MKAFGSTPPAARYACIDDDCLTDMRSPWIEPLKDSKTRSPTPSYDAEPRCQTTNPIGELHKQKPRQRVSQSRKRGKKDFAREFAGATEGAHALVHARAFVFEGLAVMARLRRGRAHTCTMLRLPTATTTTAMCAFFSSLDSPTWSCWRSQSGAFWW